MEQQQICHNRPFFVAVHIPLASFHVPHAPQVLLRADSRSIRAMLTSGSSGPGMGCLPPLSHLDQLLLPLSAISQRTALGERCFGKPQLFPPGLSNVELGSLGWNWNQNLTVEINPQFPIAENVDSGRGILLFLRGRRLVPV